MKNKKHTIKTLAKLINVSSATISRALSPETAKQLKPETYQKVMDIIEKTGFVPNESARNLREKKYNTIGLITPYFEKMFQADFYSQVLTGIFEEIENSKFDFRFIPAREKLNNYEFNHLIQKNQLAGIIIHSWNIILESFKIIQNIKIPLIVLNEEIKNSKINTVFCDNFEGGYQATKYLITMGHKKIAIIQGNPHLYDNKERFRGFMKAMNEHRLNIPDNYIYYGDYIETKAYECGKKLLLLKNRPTAVFCFNDEMALGFYQAINEFGLQCPNDISCIGYDNSRLSKYITPPLTTISQPMQEISKAATNLLIKNINNSKTKEQIYFPTSLIIRNSVLKYS